MGARVRKGLDSGPGAAKFRARRMAGKSKLPQLRDRAERAKVGRVAVQTGLLAGLWWVLHAGEWHSWIVGAPVIAAAVWLGNRMRIGALWTLHFGALARFVPYFLGASFLGGLDVGWRALHPRRPIAPALVRLPLRLPQGTPRTFFATVLSLMPGTLSVEIEDSILVVHVLSHPDASVRGVRALEERVAGLFGVGPSGGGGPA